MHFYSNGYASLIIIIVIILMIMAYSLRNPNSKLEYCAKVFIAVSHNHQNYNKLRLENFKKYLTLHVMSSIKYISFTF